MQKMQERGLQFLIEKVTWNKRWQLAPVFLAGKSHGQRTREGYSPQCHKESDLTEYIQTHIKANTFKYDHIWHFKEKRM